MMAPVSSRSASIRSFPIAISEGMLNFVSSSSCHCGPSSLGQTTRILERREREISSLMISPALIRFAEADVVGEQCDGQATAEGD